MTKKILVVGARFTGSVIARQLAEAGMNVEVIDMRGHIAGNAYDYQHEIEGGNIRVHKYGPHLFHTNNAKVFEYLSKFTNWIPYKHKVKAQLKDGSLVTLPVNAETKRIVGEENILDVFYRPYTRKMWGMELEELNPDIINRVPIRNDMNQYYFPDDKYQYLPDCG
jgi:UDP-galactopyranose mutase